MKKLLAVIITVVLALSLFTSCAEGSKAFTSAYLNLGEKYLTDLDYEKAIVCFNKAIEVEPKNERAYLGAAEAYAAVGDIDSAIAILEQGIAVVDDPTELQAMLAELLGENEPESEVPDEDVVQEEQEEEIHEFTAEEIGAAINEASVFAWGWFWDNQHTDKTDTIMGPYGNGYYRYERVSEEGITTVNDVLELTKQYFTEDVAEHMVGLKEWIEQDGVLYVSGTEGLGGDFPSYYEIYVQKTSDTSYDVTFYECYGEDEKYQSEFTYSFVDGYWVFDTLLTCDHEIPVYVLETLSNSETDNNDESDATFNKILTSSPYVYSSNGIVNASVSGTAVVDGVKDNSYKDATALEFVQKGSSNGGSEVLDEPVGRAYIINDSEWVYVWFEVYDRSLDQSSANTFEQDSVEFFWMEDDSKYQIRVRYDGCISADTGSDWADKGAEFVAVITDRGYAIESRIPITDVKENMIDMCLLINACTDGSRDYTCFILGNDDGDNAYQRTSRESDYNVWWVLALDGEFEDTRVNIYDYTLELTDDNYVAVLEIPFHVQGYMQDHVNWSWNSAGTYTSGLFGDTLEISWDYDKNSFDGYLTAENTANWTANPTFAISIGDGGYLQLPEDAEVGDTGDTARYTFTYSDITITATGYDDVVIPGGTAERRFTIKQESGYTSGTSVDIDLLSEILEQTGITLYQFVNDYLPKLTNISFSITFEAWEGITIADVEAYL